MLLKKVSMGIHGSDPDASSQKCSGHPRSRSQTPTTEKRQSGRQCRMENLVIDQSVAQKMKKSCDQSSSGDDDGIKPKETHRTPCHYSSSQPKVVLTALRPEILQSLAKDGVLKYSRYLKGHRVPHTASVEEKKIESPHRMVRKPVAQRKKNGNELSSSKDGTDDQLDSKRVHHGLCHNKSSQPKIVLTQVKPRIQQSLSLTSDLSLMSTTKERETESPCTTKKLVAQKKNGNDFSLSEDVSSSEEDADVLSSSGDDSDADLDSKRMHHAPCHYSSLQPKVVLTRIEPHVLESLSNHSSTEFTRCSQTCNQHTPAVEEKENESPSTMEKLEAQEKINGNDFSLSKDDAYAPSPSGDDNDDELDSKRSYAPSPSGDDADDELDSKRSYAPSPSGDDNDAELHPKRSSSEEDTSFPEESSTSSDFLKSKITSQPKFVLTSINGSSDWSRRLRVRPPPRPVEIEETDEDEPPLKRERQSVRLLSQKRVNYLVPSSSEDEEDKYNLVRRRAVRKDSSEDDYSMEESDSYKTRRKKMNRKIDHRERELQNEAMKPKDLSEYEQKRKKNIDEKLAFLASLKSLEVLPS